MMNQEDTQYITTVQLAEWLNIPRKTVENWRTTGRPNYGPPFARIGQLVRYNVGHVRRWLEERCHASSTGS
ncbi:MAG: helix-turn-helix domain-containing protein [bacterium]|nr:helix-turn-helix domain-containing protein [bacterium]